MKKDKCVNDFVNEELTQMRTELHKAYCPYLINFYELEDIKRALSYFLSIPSIDRNGKSSINCLLECCEEAKRFRENK